MFATAEQVLRETFAERLAGSDISIGTVVYDNDGQTGAGVPQQRHARFSVQPSGGSRESFGSPLKLYRSEGVILVELYEELGIGDESMLASADTIAGWFRGLRISSSGVKVLCEAPSVGRRGRAGAYWLRVVSIPYRAEAWLASATGA